MVKVRCTVYEGDEPLFYEEGGDRLAAADKASQRAYAEYPLVSLWWRFETIYPKIMPYESSYSLSEWDEHVRAFREGLRENV